MRAVYVNEILLGDREVVRGFIVIPKTIKEDMVVLFPKDVQELISNLINHEETKREHGFHFFTRCCQFVVIYQYDGRETLVLGTPMKMGTTIEVLYFGTSDNPNDVFDYMLKLRDSGWGEESREEIIKIARQIKNDQYESHFEIAELILKDRYDDINSFL